MNTKLITLNVLTLSALAAVLLYGQGAGPLDPPSAPADGVYRTLEEIYVALQGIDPRTPIRSLPYVVDESGSYYLAANLHFSDPTGDAISVDVANVSIDLNGFTLSSAPEVTGDAISAGHAAKRLIVRNGFIRGASANPQQPGGFHDGIGGGPSDAIFSDLVVSNCRDDGLFVQGDTIVDRCIFTDNLRTGCGFNLHGVVAQSIASNNGGSGFSCGGSASVSASVAHHNRDGIQSEGSVMGSCGSSNDNFGITGNVVVASHASSNTTGISSAVVSQCSTLGNSGDGIAETFGGKAAISLSAARLNSGDEIGNTGTRIGNFPAP